MSVALLGGPLDGTRVDWPTEERDAVFVTAEIVRMHGARYGADTEHGRIVLQEDRYRLLPLVHRLWRRGGAARHLGEA